MSQPDTGLRQLLGMTREGQTAFMVLENVMWQLFKKTDAQDVRLLITVLNTKQRLDIVNNKMCVSRNRCKNVTMNAESVWKDLLEYFSLLKPFADCFLRCPHYLHHLMLLLWDWNINSTVHSQGSPHISTFASTFSNVSNCVARNAQNMSRLVYK